VDRVTSAYASTPFPVTDIYPIGRGQEMNKSSEWLPESPLLMFFVVVVL